MKKLLLTLATALLGATLLTSGASAMKAVKLLNHQGQLLDTAGQPVTGAHVLTFRIYTDPTGGTLLHEESKTIVFGSDGLFNVQIGSDVPLDIEDLVDPNETAPEALRYLEVEVDSDGPMPRVQLVSSPYALGAFRLAGDFFSANNRLMMFDDVSGAELLVLEAGSSTQLSMTETGTSGRKSRIAVHNPEWTSFNDADPGVTIDKIGLVSDTARASLGHDHLTVSNFGSSGDDGVDMEVSPGQTEITMHSEAGASKTTRIDKASPNLMKALCNATNGADTASSALSLSTTAGGKFDLTNHNSSDDHGFIADATPTHAKVEVKSDPGVGILKAGFMTADTDGARVGLSTESTSDPHGEFWFTDLIPGAYTVREHMSVRSTSMDSAYMDAEIDSTDLRLLLGSESTTDSHGQFWFTQLEPGTYSVREHMSVRSTGTDSAYKHLDIDSAAVRLAMGSESTTDEHGYFWFTHLDPGLTGGVTQTMIARSSPTDSAFGQIKIDSSEAGLRMNKADLIAHISSKTGSAHMSLTDISAADKGEIRMQHNESDLNFVMRHHGTTDTAKAEMQADGNSGCWVRVSQLSSSGNEVFGLLQAESSGAQLQLREETTGGFDEISIKPIRLEMTSAQITPSQTKVLLMPSFMEMTDSSTSGNDTLFRLDRNGTLLGPTLAVRYPGSAGPATEVFIGDLNGDAVPDLSVDGNVGIGSTAPTEKLHVAGNICVTGNYLTCSDARYKSDVEPIHDAMAQLQQLQGVEFNWRQSEFADRDFPEARQMGFVAQEVQAILPGVVSEGSDGYLAMDYARLTPLLVEALKAQQERIDKLEALLLQLAENQITR